MKWFDIDEAPLGKTVMLWHRAWRAPFPGKRIGETGRVWIDTCELEARGREDWATHFAYIDAPENVQRDYWGAEGFATSLN